MAQKFDHVNEWLEFDKNHLWHPYTSMNDPLPVYPVVGARGCEIELEDGRKIIDGMASWWSAVHGYNHPKLNQAIIDQTQKTAHIMFGGIAHQPASELGKRLVDMTPEPFQNIFLADSGSISIEVGLKMALQYYQSQKKLDKTKFLTVRGGYHGDPFSCMSVGDPNNGAHYLFPKVIAKHYYAERPKIKWGEAWSETAMDELKDMVKKHHQELAAIIVEPIVQGGVGMYFYHQNYLKGLRELCDEYDILLVFDEIATGFGRTGKLFAMEHADILPDIFCVGKAITGGMMTLAAAITTRKVADTISEGDVPNLMHGPTFMANPLACSVASASLDILLEEDDRGVPYWQSNITRLNEKLELLYQVKDHKNVAEVRTIGGIGVIETKEMVDVGALQKFYVERGVWIRPFGKLIYVMPPYILSNSELEKLMQAMIDSLDIL